MGTKKLLGWGEVLVQLSLGELPMVNDKVCVLKKLAGPREMCLEV